MEAWCSCYNAMTFPCRLLNGECEFTTEDVPDAPTRVLIESLPNDMAEFLATDLDATVGTLAPDLLVRLHKFQDATLRTIQKAALIDAWAEHILDNGLEDVPSITWADKKAATLATCITAIGPGMVEAVEVKK